MDDDQILMRGGTEADIAEYARRNGADLAPNDMKTPNCRNTPRQQQRRVRAPASEWRSATLLRDIKGEYSTWKKGEVVWARQYKPGIFHLEKMNRIPSGIYKRGLTCLNECCGIPRRVLKLHSVRRSNADIRRVQPDNQQPKP